MNKIEAKARDVIRYVREATTAGTPEHEIERRVIDVLWGVFHNMGYVEPDEAAQEVLAMQTIAYEEAEAKARAEWEQDEDEKSRHMEDEGPETE